MTDQQYEECKQFIKDKGRPELFGPGWALVPVNVVSTLPYGSPPKFLTEKDLVGPARVIMVGAADDKDLFDRLKGEGLLPWPAHLCESPG